MSENKENIIDYHKNSEYHSRENPDAVILERRPRRNSTFRKLQNQFEGKANNSIVHKSRSTEQQSPPQKQIILACESTKDLASVTPVAYAQNTTNRKVSLIHRQQTVDPDLIKYFSRGTRNETKTKVRRNRWTCDGRDVPEFNLYVDQIFDKLYQNMMSADVPVQADLDQSFDQIFRRLQTNAQKDSDSSFEQIFYGIMNIYNRDGEETVSLGSKSVIGTKLQNVQTFSTFYLHLYI